MTMTSSIVFASYSLFVFGVLVLIVRRRAI